MCRTGPTRAPGSNRSDNREDAITPVPKPQPRERNQIEDVARSGDARFRHDPLRDIDQFVLLSEFGTGRYQAPAEATFEVERLTPEAADADQVFEAVSAATENLRGGADYRAGRDDAAGRITWTWTSDSTPLAPIVAAARKTFSDLHPRGWRIVEDPTPSPSIRPTDASLGTSHWGLPLLQLTLVNRRGAHGHPAECGRSAMVQSPTSHGRAAVVGRPRPDTPT